MQSELQRLEAESYLLHSSIGLISVTEMRMEIEEHQGSWKDSTGLCGSPLGLLLDAVQPQKSESSWQRVFFLLSLLFTHQTFGRLKFGTTAYSNYIIAKSDWATGCQDGTLWHCLRLTCLVLLLSYKQVNVPLRYTLAQSSLSPLRPCLLYHSPPRELMKNSFKFSIISMC